jgi:hypothetical protein
MIELPGTKWVPLLDLRFVLRDGERILQAPYILVYASNEGAVLPQRLEWRDVPCIEEPK